MPDGLVSEPLVPPVPVMPVEPLVSEPLVPPVPADEPGVGVDEPGVGVADEPAPLGFGDGPIPPGDGSLEPELGLPAVEPPAVDPLLPGAVDPAAELPEPACATVRR